MNRGFENDSAENDLADVEHLLKSMSLKTPSETLNQSIEELGRAVRRPFIHTWPGLLTLATTSMIVGLLLGRLIGDEKTVAPNPILVSNRLEDTNSLPATSNDSLALSSDGNTPETQLDDRGLFFVNGTVPVRKYVAQSQRKIEVFDSLTGTTKTVFVPVRKTIVTPAPGI